MSIAEFYKNSSQAINEIRDFYLGINPIPINQKHVEIVQSFEIPKLKVGYNNQ